MQDEPNEWPDTEAIRWWIELTTAVAGIALPIVLITIAVVTGESTDTIIWVGIMGVMFGLILMYGVTPQRFGLFPPGTRRRGRRRRGGPHE